MEDNGIVILKTKDHLSETGYEYRVSYIPSVGSLYGPFDDNTLNFKYNQGALLDFFGPCDVFENLDMAMDQAKELAAPILHLENGIQVFEVTEDIEFYDL